MTQPTPSLAEFLLARIDEDEAQAEGAAAAHLDAEESRWKAVEWGEGVGQVVLAGRGGAVVADTRNRGDFGGVGWYAARHIARHDPARVLAECEAKRRIVELHDGDNGRPHKVPMPWPDGDVTAWECQACGAWCSDGPGDGECLADWRAPSLTLRLLAAPYSDHPDFDPRWRS